jgi:hypothetical protein
MTTFDAREKEFEARFKHDQEFRFKVAARRNRLLGLWAAAQLGHTGDTAEQYARAVVAAQFEPGGDEHVIDMLAADFAVKNPAVTRDRIRFELDHFAARARAQLLQE